MQSAAGLTFAGKSLVVVTTCWCLALPILANAQGSPGQDAVYNSTNGIMGSSSFIDASTFGGSHFDICAVLYGILSSVSTPYPSSGAVIDARGLPGTTGTKMTCAAGTTPWNNGVTFVTVPSTILLPATAGANPIVIPSTWALPPNTHLIGETSNITSSGFTPGTTLQAHSSFIAGTAMVSFGVPSLCTAGCAGISVENLTLDGQGQSINGIVNSLSQDSSYVNHVGLYRILGTGLSVLGNASNSGPYSNINFDLGGYSGTSSTICASINGVSGTHGIHGLTCISESTAPPAAVLLDASNNSLEDVRIVGFYDGIRVGENAPAQSNVLVNIYGDTAACPPPCSGLSPPVNVVHITGDNKVTDISIMGAGNAGGSNTITIQDDLTSTTLPDATLGIYALGETLDGGYSRYTTSPNAATWVAGTNSPTGTCARGSLYSCVNSANPSTCNNNMSVPTALWACALNSSNALQWIAVK